MQEQLDATVDSLVDHDAERSVIGSILIDGKVISRVADKLKVEHFDSEAHQYIYAACVEVMIEPEIEIDQQTLRNRLEYNGHLEDVGGDSYLSHCVSHLPHAENIVGYAQTVTNLYVLRRLAEAGKLAVGLGTDVTRAKDPDSAVKEAEEALFAVGAVSADQDFVKLELAPSVRAFYAAEKDSDKADAANAPILTGLDPIDDHLGGLHRSDLVVIAARPGFGKSMLALNCAFKGAENGRSVGIFSLEMGIDQVVHRMAASRSKVDIATIRLKSWNQREERRISDAMAQLSARKIFVDDTAIQTVAAMRTKAQRLKTMHGLDLLIVDYMQLISGSTSGRDGNRVQEVSEISRYLKAMARDLNVPVLACSQLNRGVEHRKTQEPRLSDLRESGSIEQDADVVMFIHRDDKFFSQEEWDRRNPTQPYPSGVAKIVIAKHRHGPTGELVLAVRDEFGLFSSFNYDENSPN